jgi:hypothetical protein
MRSRYLAVRGGLTGCAAALTLSLVVQAQERPKFASIPVLVRQQQAGPAATLALLRESIPAARSATSDPEELRDRVRISGSTWRLDVFGDGSGAEFADAAAFDRAHSTGVDPSRAMSNEALEASGRSFVERTLPRLIVLQQDERLVLAAASRRTEGGVAPGGERAYSAVVASRVVFSREIGGIPVVGAGSKVTVTFLNDGSVESFRYDWPVYRRTGRVQAMASPIEVLHRLQRVGGVRMKHELDRDLKAVPSLESISGHIKLGAAVELQDLKCGYYDPGFALRDRAAPIQAGCYYHLVETRGEGDYLTTAGYSGAVPAAASFEPDKSWPEANVLRGTKAKEPTGRTAGSSKKIQPVSPRPGAQGQ